MKAIRFAVPVGAVLALLSSCDPPPPDGCYVLGSARADAGPNQAVYKRSYVTLNGTGSVGVHNLTYKWSFVSIPDGGTASLSSWNNSSQAQFLADIPGTYVARLIVNDGCGDSPPALARITATDAPPVADAGPDQIANKRTYVVLDGTRSYDPDGDPLTYQWTLGKPDGSTATLSNPAYVLPAFVPDLAGSYVATLVVNDGTQNSAPSMTHVTVLDPPPVAVTAPRQFANERAVVTLDGTRSYDVDGDPLTYQWSMLSKPDASVATLSSPATARPTFTADIEGQYLFSLTVNDGTSNSPDASVAVTVYRYVNLLNYALIDAEYSRPLDRLITVSATPNLVHIYDPSAETEQQIALPAAPQTIGISPTGQQAVVGHNGFITLVDLDAGVVLKSMIPSGVSSYDVVFASNGWVYSTSAAFGDSNFHATNLADGGLGVFGNAAVDNQSHASWSSRLGALYYSAATTGSGYRVSVDGGAGAFASGSSSNTCSRLWLSDDEAHLFTACGAVMTTAAFPPATDWTSVAGLGGSVTFSASIAALDHSTDAGLIVTIPPYYPYADTGADRQTLEYSATSYALTRTTPLPFYVDAGFPLEAGGRFAFYNRQGSSHVVVVAIDGGVFIPPAWGIVRY